MTMTDWPKEGIQSSAVDMLQAVLNEWCAAKAIDIKSPEAEVAARALVDWYEFGIKDAAELKALLDG